MTFSLTASDERDAVGKFDLNANAMCPKRRWAAQWKYNAMKLFPKVLCRLLSSNTRITYVQ